MKVLSRDFTLKEKILLIIFALFLLGVAYYRFFYIPTGNAIEKANTQRDEYQIELGKVMAKEKKIREMSEELDAIGELSKVSRMESYNNSKEELSLLNRVLAPATDYSITFSNVTRNDDQIRRNFSLSFQTNDFATAKKIIKSLEESPYRCLLGDIQYVLSLARANDDEKTRNVRKINDVYYYDVVTVNTSATFYETMVGGTSDAGLPASNAKK